MSACGKWVRIDTAFTLVRHVTAASTNIFVASLGEQLGRSEGPQVSTRQEQIDALVAARKKCRVDMLARPEGARGAFHCPGWPDMRAVRDGIDGNA